MTDTSPAAVEVMAQYYSGWARDIRVQGIHSADAEYRDETANTLRALSAERDAANARADHARDKALLEAAERFPGGRQPWPPNAIRKAILALRDKPAETAPQPALCDTSELQPALAVTVDEVILEVWGCCEELEDEALSKLSVVKTEHEKGFWAGQKMTAKRIRRATQMPIAGGGDE